MGIRRALGNNVPIRSQVIDAHGVKGSRRIVEGAIHPDEALPSTRLGCHYANSRHSGYTVTISHAHHVGAGDVNGLADSSLRGTLKLEQIPATNYLELTVNSLLGQ